MIGNRIYALRKSLGINQVDFAKIMGITQASVSNWDKGVIRLKNLLKLAEMYPEVSAEWLLRGKGKIMKEKVDPNQEIRELERELYLIKREKDALNRTLVDLYEKIDRQ